MRLFRISAIVALGALVVGAASPRSDAQPRSVALGEPFDLAVGGSARIEGEALQIGFEDVAADSRCPEGDRCVWAGDATVVVSLQKGSAAKERRELHTSPKQQEAVGFEGYEVRLVRLAPYPVSGRAIAKRDYRATLEIGRGTPAVDR